MLNIYLEIMTDVSLLNNLVDFKEEKEWVGLEAAIVQVAEDLYLSAR